MSNGEKIKQLISARNWSQNTFAKETGVAQSYISYIIRGKAKLSDSIAKKICKALDIDTSYFEDEEEVQTAKVEQEVENVTVNVGDDIENYNDIFEITQKITELRKMLLEKIKVERENDKLYNGVDLDFLHEIENLDKLSEKEAIEMVLNERKTRKNRRITKNRIFLLQGLLKLLPIVDYYSFAKNGYEQTKNYKYNPRVPALSNENNIEE